MRELNTRAQSIHIGQTDTGRSRAAPSPMERTRSLNTSRLTTGQQSKTPLLPSRPARHRRIAPWLRLSRAPPGERIAHPFRAAGRARGCGPARWHAARLQRFHSALRARDVGLTGCRSRQWTRRAAMVARLCAAPPRPPHALLMARRQTRPPLRRTEKLRAAKALMTPLGPVTDQTH